MLYRTAKKCYNFVMLNTSLLEKNQTVAVALSGGKDSVCLLYSLLGQADRLQIFVKAINVEHGIRGQASVLDTEFVKELCKKLNVPLKCYSVNALEFAKKNSLSTEQAARILRYQCFDNALIEGFCDVVATAHHKNDATETVLFNLLRGCALSGVCGINKKQGKIIRPLLDTSREEIDKFVQQNNLPFVTDETNNDDGYSRNFLRNKVIPIIKTRFSNIDDAVYRFSQIATQENALLDSLASQLIDGNSVKFTEKDQEPLFRRACLAVMKNNGFTVNYEKKHLDALAELKNLQTGARIDLKNGLVAYKRYDKVVFEKNDGNLTQHSNAILPIPFKMGEIVFSKYKLTFEKTHEREQGALVFDFDKLPYNTVIRTKQSGDVIKTFGGKSKTLKKYLTDKKIPSKVSEHFPLLAFDSEILAVCPIDISEKIKIDEKSVNLVKITCELI